MQKKHLWGLVLFVCLGFFAAFLWPGPGTDEIDLFVPISLRNIPPDISISNPAVNGLEIRIRGPKHALAPLAKTPPHCQLDLSGINTGVENIPIKPEQIPLPPGISVVSIAPATITLWVERKLTKTLPISITYTGTPLSGYQVSNAAALPATIVVSGPEKILAPLSGAATKPISLDGALESFKKEIALELPEALEIVSDKAVIVAEITIEEKVLVKTFEGIPVEGRNTSYEFTITPPTINIDVKGAEKILNRLIAEKTIAVSVNLDGLKPGVYVRRAVIDLPVETTLAGVEPEIFTVTIKGREK